MKHTNFSSLCHDAFGGEPHAHAERCAGSIFLVKVQGITARLRMEWPEAFPPCGRDALAYVLERFDAQHPDIQIDLWNRFRQLLPDARRLAPAYNESMRVMAEVRRG